MTRNTKLNIIKYTFLTSTVLYSIFMFFKWFVIETVITEPEAHSLLTIPGFFIKGTDFIKEIIGNNATFVLLIAVGTLEYLCIVSAALGIWGVIRTFMKNRRSRLLLASQVTSFLLMAITIIGIVVAAFVANKPMFDNLFSISPTLLLLVSYALLIVSIVTGIIYNKMAIKYAKLRANYIKK